jgi:hypothetical protein
VARPRNNPNSVVLPKRSVVGVQTTDASTGKGRDASIPDSNIAVLNKSVADVRLQPSASAALRLLARVSGDTGMALASQVRLANTPLQVRVYDDQHQLSEEGSLLYKSLLNRLEYSVDYTQGYDERLGLKGLVDTLLYEVLYTGACALELVLDKARLPYKLQPVAPSSVRWKTGTTATGPNNTKIVPYQQSQGETIELDIPTFFYQALDANPQTIYPTSPLEPALNAAIFQAETLEDIRRVVKRSGHSRLVMKIITEQLMKVAPLEVRNDPTELSKWVEQVRNDLAQEVEALDPQSALIVFDTIEANYLNSEIGASADYKPLIEIVDGTTATALRTPPSVLGKRFAGGSQNISSTESLLFIKQVEGLRTPVQAVLARALTLAMRLFGFAGYVQLGFAPIDLRPETELEAFKTMHQTRVLELLSYGFLTDQEAAEWLGTGMRAPDAPPLSGTMFLNKGGQVDPLGMDTQSSTTGDPGARGLTGNAPKRAGGASQ